MHYAIFDTGPGFLQWFGEASSAADAIKLLRSEAEDFVMDAGSSQDEIIVVYELQDAEVRRLDKQLTDGDHIQQRFTDKGREYTLAEVRKIAH